jgi:hypothetical protein
VNGRLKTAVLELRWPLIALGAALLVGGALVVATLYVEHSKAQTHKQAQSRLRAARLQVENLRRDEQNFTTYRNTYQMLAEKGLFAPAQRLAWIDYMNRLTSRGEVQSVSYEIGAEKPLPISMPETKNIDVLASRIQLKMGFFHEGDMVRTLDDLRQSDTGFYRIDNCAVRRTENIAASSVRENLSADCILQWIVFRNKFVGSSK